MCCVGLPPSSLLPPLSAPSEASNALVKRSKGGGAGYNYIVEADKLEKILELSRYDNEIVSAMPGGESFGVLS